MGSKMTIITIRLSMVNQTNQEHPAGCPAVLHDHPHPRFRPAPIQPIVLAVPAGIFSLFIYLVLTFHKLVLVCVGLLQKSTIL